MRISAGATILFCSCLLAFLAIMIADARHENINSAYARCTEEDVKTGNCRLPDAPVGSVNQNSSSSTPQMLQECRDLRIAPERCTEEQILAARHITTRCPPGVSDPNSISEPKLDPFIAEILAGLGVTFVASIFGIRNLRGIKKKRTTTEGNRD